MFCWRRREGGSLPKYQVQPLINTVEHISAEKSLHSVLPIAAGDSPLQSQFQNLMWQN